MTEAPKENVSSEPERTTLTINDSNGTTEAVFHNGKVTWYLPDFAD